MELREYSISEISTLKYGKMLAKEEFKEKGFPVYSGYRVTGYTDSFLYEEPMVIVVARGVGGTGDVKISPERSWITNLSIVLDTNNELVDKYFLAALLNQDNLKAKLDSGASISQITINALEPYRVKLPSLDVQRKASLLLKTYDHSIENNNRRIVILEEMAQSLYREWFVKFRYPGHENRKLVESPLGLIPEGWEVKTLSEIGKVNPENISAKSAPERIYYIDISSVGNGTIDEQKDMEFSAAPSRARRKVSDGDIIWATVRPNRKQFAYISNPKKDTVVSTGFAVLRAREVPASFLYYMSTTDDFVSYLVNHATGSAYPAVNSGDFEKALLVVPDNNLLKEFDEFVSRLLRIKSVLFKKNDNLKLQKDMLLPKLISGSITI